MKNVSSILQKILNGLFGHPSNSKSELSWRCLFPGPLSPRSHPNLPPSPCSEALLLQFLEHSSTIHHTQVLQEPPTERELLSQCLEASCGKYYPTFLSVGSLVALKSSEAQRRFTLPRLAHPAFHNVLTAPHHGFNVCLSQSMCPVAGIRFILPFTDAESSHLLKPTGYKIDRTCRFISSRMLVSSRVRLLLQYSL